MTFSRYLFDRFNSRHEVHGTRRTFERHERPRRPRRRPQRRLKATRKEQQHDAPSSAP